MCGIAGIRNSCSNVAEDLYVALLTLQHRGQESAGMVTYDGEGYHEKIAVGPVETVLREAELKNLKGNIAIGHVRYSTISSSDASRAQPIRGKFNGSSDFYVAHNGNLTNINEIKHVISNSGLISNSGFPITIDKFVDLTDTQLFVLLLETISRTQKSFLGAVKESLALVRGTYCLVILHQDKLIACRDWSGNRPLYYGSDCNREVIASESVVFKQLAVNNFKEIKPGEILILERYKKGGSDNLPENLKSDYTFAPCILEAIYFSRHDGLFEGRRIELIRNAFGRQLFSEQPAQADLIIPVPDSGSGAAAGFARASGIPLETRALTRWHYSSRTFIEPTRERRDFKSRLKFIVIPELVKNQRIVVVDDSIIRGTVIRWIIKLLREAGAREIHVRIGCPPTTHPCFYGIDTYRISDELIIKRNKFSIEAVRQEIKADSLGYLSLNGMIAALKSIPGPSIEEICHACFSGEYKIGIRDEDKLNQIRS